jgi:hypothetical protein
MMMLRNPELNFRCGTLALAEIARMQGKPTSTVDALIQEGHFLRPLTRCSNPNPWGSVSDEGGFWRSRHPHKLSAAARAIKPTEVGDTTKFKNATKRW